MTSDTLIRIVYDSRRAPAVSDFEIVEDVILPSVARNRRADITGCLWFDHERFVQVIEGPAVAVGRLYDAIVADARHVDVRLRERVVVADRRFDRFGLRSTPGRTPAGIERLLALPPGPFDDELLDEVIMELLAAPTAPA